MEAFSDLTPPPPPSAPHPHDVTVDQAFPSQPARLNTAFIRHYTGRRSLTFILPGPNGECPETKRRRSLARQKLDIWEEKRARRTNELRDAEANGTSYVSTNSEWSGDPSDMSSLSTITEDTIESCDRPTAEEMIKHTQKQEKVYQARKGSLQERVARW